MRNLVALLCLSLAGCVSAPFSADPVSERPMATLTIGPRAGYPVLQKHDGIWSVDSRDIPNGPVQSLFVVPGKHKIGYNCPGWITMDGPAILPYVFEADRRYEINCEKEPYIRPMPDGA